MKLTLPIILLALAAHGQPMPMAAPVPQRGHAVAVFGTNYGNSMISFGSNIIIVTNGQSGTLSWSGTDDGYFIGVWPGTNTDGIFPAMHYVGPVTSCGWPLPPPMLTCIFSWGNYPLVTNPPSPTLIKGYTTTEGQWEAFSISGDGVNWTNSYALLPAANAGFTITRK